MWMGHSGFAKYVAVTAEPTVTQKPMVSMLLSYSLMRRMKLGLADSECADVQPRRTRAVGANARGRARTRGKQTRSKTCARIPTCRLRVNFSRWCLSRYFSPRRTICTVPYGTGTGTGTGTGPGTSSQSETPRRRCPFDGSVCRMPCRTSETPPHLACGIDVVS